MTGRPRKEFSVRVNGGSLQCFIRGEYVGSQSIAELCEKVRDERRDSEVSAQ